MKWLVLRSASVGYNIGGDVIGQLRTRWGSYIWQLVEMKELAKYGFFVKYDACRFNSTLPGEGRYRKATSILTNAPWLRTLARKCQCEESHVVLSGKVLFQGHWRDRTAIAA